MITDIIYNSKDYTVDSKYENQVVYCRNNFNANSLLVRKFTYDNTGLTTKQLFICISNLKFEKENITTIKDTNTCISIIDVPTEISDRNFYTYNTDSNIVKRLLIDKVSEFYISILDDNGNPVSFESKPLLLLSFN